MKLYHKTDWSDDSPERIVIYEASSLLIHQNLYLKVIPLILMLFSLYTKEVQKNPDQRELRLAFVILLRFSHSFLNINFGSELIKKIIDILIISYVAIGSAKKFINERKAEASLNANHHIPYIHSGIFIKLLLSG